MISVKRPLCDDGIPTATSALGLFEHHARKRGQPSSSAASSASAASFASSSCPLSAAEQPAAAPAASSASSSCPSSAAEQPAAASVTVGASATSLGAASEPSSDKPALPAVSKPTPPPSLKPALDGDAKQEAETGRCIDAVDNLSATDSDDEDYCRARREANETKEDRKDIWTLSSSSANQLAVGANGISLTFPAPVLQRTEICFREFDLKEVPRNGVIVVVGERPHQYASFVDAAIKSAPQTKTTTIALERGAADRLDAVVEEQVRLVDWSRSGLYPRNVQTLIFDDCVAAATDDDSGSDDEPVTPSDVGISNAKRETTIRRAEHLLLRQFHLTTRSSDRCLGPVDVVVIYPTELSSCHIKRLYADHANRIVTSAVFEQALETFRTNGLALVLLPRVRPMSHEKCLFFFDGRPVLFSQPVGPAATTAKEPLANTTTTRAKTGYKHGAETPADKETKSVSDDGKSQPAPTADTKATEGSSDDGKAEPAPTADKKSKAASSDAGKSRPAAAAEKDAKGGSRDDDRKLQSASTTPAGEKSTESIRLIPFRRLDLKEIAFDHVVAVFGRPPKGCVPFEAAVTNFAPHRETVVLQKQKTEDDDPIPKRLLNELVQKQAQAADFIHAEHSQMLHAAHERAQKEREVDIKSETERLVERSLGQKVWQYDFHSSLQSLLASTKARHDQKWLDTKDKYDRRFLLCKQQIAATAIFDRWSALPSCELSKNRHRAMNNATYFALRQFHLEDRATGIPPGCRSAVDWVVIYPGHSAGDVGEIRRLYQNYAEVFANARDFRQTLDRFAEKGLAMVVDRRRARHPPPENYVFSWDGRTVASHLQPSDDPVAQKTAAAPQGSATTSQGSATTTRGSATGGRRRIEIQATLSTDDKDEQSDTSASDDDTRNGQETLSDGDDGKALSDGDDAKTSSDSDIDVAADETSSDNDITVSASETVAVFRPRGCGMPVVCTESISTAPSLLEVKEKPQATGLLRCPELEKRGFKPFDPSLIEFDQTVAVPGPADCGAIAFCRTIGFDNKTTMILEDDEWDSMEGFREFINGQDAAAMRVHLNHRAAVSDLEEKAEKDANERSHSAATRKADAKLRVEAHSELHRRMRQEHCKTVLLNRVCFAKDHERRSLVRTVLPNSRHYLCRTMVLENGPTAIPRASPPCLNWVVLLPSRQSTEELARFLSDYGDPRTSRSQQLERIAQFREQRCALVVPLCGDLGRERQIFYYPVPVENGQCREEATTASVNEKKTEQILPTELEELRQLEENRQLEEIRQLQLRKVQQLRLRLEQLRLQVAGVAARKDETKAQAPGAREPEQLQLRAACAVDRKDNAESKAPAARPDLSRELDCEPFDPSMVDFDESVVVIGPAGSGACRALHVDETSVTFTGVGPMADAGALGTFVEKRLDIATQIQTKHKVAVGAMEDRVKKRESEGVPSPDGAERRRENFYDDLLHKMRHACRQTVVLDRVFKSESRGRRELARDLVNNTSHYACRTIVLEDGVLPKPGARFDWVVVMPHQLSKKNLARFTEEYGAARAERLALFRDAGCAMVMRLAGDGPVSVFYLPRDAVWGARAGRSAQDIHQRKHVAKRVDAGRVDAVHVDTELSGRRALIVKAAVCFALFALLMLQWVFARDKRPSDHHRVRRS